MRVALGAGTIGLDWMRAVATLRNTTISKDEQILGVSTELERQINGYNEKVEEITKLNSNISESLKMIMKRDEKVFTLESAVTSLKDIVQENNRKITNLNKEIGQNEFRT